MKNCKTDNNGPNYVKVFIKREISIKFEILSLIVLNGCICDFSRIILVFCKIKVFEKNFFCVIIRNV